MTRVVVSPRAESELEDIWLSIATDNPLAATKVVRDIGERIGSLVRHPRLGPRRPDISPIVRVLVEHPYLIIYEHHPSGDEGPVELVDIISVIDGRRDVTALF